MGKVYLVGAGAGDPGLYTIRAKEIIEQADAIVYDFLANEVFLDWIKPGCEVIYAGKRGGDHTLSQDEINELLVRLARENKVVVRLKGGDPYVFGRGGEEAEFLVKEGVEFEVVPGVSSAVAAPAYAGIPITHRDFSSSITFVTGHEAKDKEKSALNWDALARSASTLVFFMGVKNLPVITENLIKAGLSKDTPACLIRWGTTCRQRTVVSVLSEIATKAKELNIKPPALLIVGEVVRLKSKLSWFEKKPLLGKNIIVTRSRSQASELIKILQQKGACCIQFPTIDIAPLKDYSELYQAIDKINSYDWIIFTSVNGVKFFFKKLFEMGYDCRCLASSKICAIGPATEKKLREYSIIADVVPERYVAEAIVESLKEKEIRGKNILIPRAKEARDVLITELTKLNANVVVVPVYETVLGKGNSEEIIEKIKAGEIDYITFTSSSTVKNFFSLVPEKIVSDYGNNIKFACIGPITAKTLKDFGFSSHIVPETYTIEALVEEIEKHNI
jgi:uroporphyrinogen III methyltransferase/synthase